MSPSSKSNKGFSLLELLIIIAILAVLGLVVIMLLNPIKRFSDARNSRRYADVDSISTAIHEYIVNSRGTMVSGITTTEKQLGICVTGGNTVCSSSAAIACLNLSSTLSQYLKSIPIDPASGSASTTHYSVARNSNNIVTVKACDAENGVSVQISR